ncbi:hypothetical protein P280DRAFT_470633 [Massarina eburnea CBS 473.64]|uniref:Uncharacterized protein n=1 Tax=Massarina eburnea CBS 473.64 TaxID=1395130 RepID=A0A6A6RYF9_9PLEO|nr:hypothetical protein P280DRAFT_470633 [Massarina eburnea CBS 473.64]
MGLLPRRFQFLLALVLLFVITILTLGPPSPASIPTVEQVKDAVKNPHLPKVSVPEVSLPSVSLPSVADVYNSIGQPSHKAPAKQANSTASSSYRAIEWFSDFKWRNPFSSAVTLDENRALLPPLKERPSIYTYYEPKPKQDKALKEAENRLVLAWRRAWWAQGFRPQVLGRKEAMSHPQYRIIQRLKLAPSIEFEIMRWFAWGQMGGGLLTNWLAFPMADHDNPMLAFLRRGEYPELSRVKTLDNGVFFGDGAAVNDAIEKAVNNKLFVNATANSDKIAKLAKTEGGLLVNLLEAKVNVDEKANGIAYYSTSSLSNKYAGKYRSISEKMTNVTSVEGLELLAVLINSHLHLTFQESYSEGLAVVKPLPEHTTALMYEAIDIARNITQCPTTPMPKSCPPNRQSCKPCDATNPNKLELLTTLKNSTKQYTIGTVPHPYTLTSLHYTIDPITPKFTRTNTQRDIWINEVAKDIVPDLSERWRLLNFKLLVAAPDGAHHSLWLTAERISQADIDWILGFSPPQASYKKDEPAPTHLAELTLFPRPDMPSPLVDVEVPQERWIKSEEERLKKAREALMSKDRNMVVTVQAVEAWNAADTEAWKFARAFSARRRVERKKWEEEEQKYAGSEKKAGVRPVAAGGRWSD